MNFDREKKLGNENETELGKVKFRNASISFLKLFEMNLVMLMTMFLQIWIIFSVSSSF